MIWQMLLVGRLGAQQRSRASIRMTSWYHGLNTLGVAVQRELPPYRLHSDRTEEAPHALLVGHVCHKQLGAVHDIFVPQDSVDNQLFPS